MPIDIQCQECKKRFRVPDKFGGRRVKCPNCEKAILVQAARPAEDDSAKRQPAEKPMADSGVTASPPTEQMPRPAVAEEPPKPDSSVQRAAAEEPEPEAPSDEGYSQWYLHTDDGERYGPVDREELNSWVAEGRINGACKLLCDGWDQWKWADEVFPQLAEEASTEDGPLVAVGDSGKAVAAARPKRSDKQEAAGGEAAAGGAERTLAETRPWVLLVAVLALGTSAIGVVASLVMLILSIIGVTVYGIVLAVALLASYGLGIWPAFLLLVYAQRMGAYVAKAGTAELEQALAAQRAFWRLTGILALAAVGLWLVAGLLLLILMLVGT